MKAVYDKLEKEGKIGPRDEHGGTRPFAEYPKALYSKGRPTAVVNSQREELAHFASMDAPPVESLDEADRQQQVLLSEINRLKGEKEELERKLAMADSTKHDPLSPVKTTAPMPSAPQKLDANDAAKGGVLGRLHPQPPVPMTLAAPTKLTT